VNLLDILKKFYLLNRQLEIAACDVKIRSVLFSSIWHFFFDQKWGFRMALHLTVQERGAAPKSCYRVPEFLIQSPWARHRLSFRLSPASISRISGFTSRSTILRRFWSLRERIRGSLPEPSPPPGATVLTQRPGFPESACFGHVPRRVAAIGSPVGRMRL
jgi:hypothetical protein